MPRGAPCRQLTVEIVGGVGEGREQQNLTIVAVDWRVNLPGDQLLQSGEFGIAVGGHGASRRQQRRQPVAMGLSGISC